MRKLLDKYNKLLNEQATPPVVGEFWCSNNTSQGNGCVEIIDANHPIYNNSSNTPYPGVTQSWTPGVPTLMTISQVSPSFGPFYSSKQSCEASCGNHYYQNCFNYNNGSSGIGNVSFPNLTTSEKDSFCLKCNDLPNSTVRSHPYCWCLDNGTGSPPVPPLGSNTAIYNCPDDDDNTALGCTDPTAINYNPLATVDDGSCKYEDDPDKIYCECCKKSNGISMVQTVSSPADCIGAENTVYAGMGVYGCNVSPVSGGPGTICKKPIPTGPKDKLLEKRL